MYNKKEERFEIGEKLTLDEIKKFAALDRNLTISVTREERLLLKYCYALNNATFYMQTEDGRLHDHNNLDERKAMIDMFAYLLNVESLAMVNSNRKIKFNDPKIMRIGGYNQDIIEFALLQAGYRVICDDYNNSDINAYRFDSDREYSVERCRPLDVRELADSINAKLEEEKVNSL